MPNRLRRCVLTFFLFFIFVLCGCQATPEQSVVTNKNGVFDAALENNVAENSTEGKTEEIEGEKLPVSEKYESSFSSANGSILYEISVQQTEDIENMDVLRVTPHTFTSEEAEHIAHAIFGDATVYEYSTGMSKAELEKSILEMRQYISNWDALVEHYGGDETLAAQVERDYEERIGNLERLYSTASDNVEPMACEWAFHDYGYYEDPSWGSVFGDASTQELKATIWAEGLPYVYCVVNRDEQDYRLHNISAYIDDLLVPESQKYSTEPISDADVEVLCARAKKILDGMGMGEWVVESAEVASRGSDDELFSVCTVIACPVYNGIKVSYQEQLSNLKSDDAYASNYYYENITFTFSGGRLTSFYYYSPLDVVDVKEQVAVLSFDEVVEKFQTQMKLNDAEYYWGATTAETEVTDVELGLARIRIQNNETDFYLTPAYTFRGTTTIYDSVGRVIEFMPGVAEVEESLLTVNAVDGTIINTQLGY